MVFEHLNLRILVLPHQYILFNLLLVLLSHQQTDTILPGKSSKIEVKYNMAVGLSEKRLR
jgi:hypothetical protein